MIDLLFLLRDMDPSISATQPWQKLHTKASSKPHKQLAQAIHGITYGSEDWPCEDFLSELYRLGETLRARDIETRAEEQLSLPIDDLQWLETRLRALRGKVVFTAMGHTGLTVGDVAEHDELVVADGFGLPAVLRSTGSKGSDEEEFKLVGLAYLNGMMTGEFEDPDLIDEILRLEKRTYHVC